MSSLEVGRHPTKQVESAGRQDWGGYYNNLSKAGYLCYRVSLSLSCHTLVMESLKLGPRVKAFK